MPPRRKKGPSTEPVDTSGEESGSVRQTSILLPEITTTSAVRLRNSDWPAASANACPKQITLGQRPSRQPSRRATRSAKASGILSSVLRGPDKGSGCQPLRSASGKTTSLQKTSKHRRRDQKTCESQDS